MSTRCHVFLSFDSNYGIMRRIQLGRTKCNVPESLDVKHATAAATDLRLHHSKMSYCSSAGLLPPPGPQRGRPASDRRGIRARVPQPPAVIQFVLNHSSGGESREGVRHSQSAQGRPTETALMAGGWFAKRGSNHIQHLLGGTLGEGRGGDGEEWVHGTRRWNVLRVMK